MKPKDQKNSDDGRDGNKKQEKSHRYSARRSSSGTSRNQQGRFVVESSAIL